MRGELICSAPHVLRGADGLAYADDLEVVGSHACEAWVRCKKCGAWFWLCTDVDDRYQHVGAVALDAALAARAFVSRDLDAIAELVVTNDVPNGPVWTTASAMVEIFCALTPGETDDARARALGRVSGGTRWAGAAELLVKQARALERAAPPTLKFLVDLRLPDYRFVEVHEVGSALVVIPDGKSELLRLDATGLVRLPLGGSVLKTFTPAELSRGCRACRRDSPRRRTCSAPRSGHHVGSFKQQKTNHRRGAQPIYSSCSAPSPAVSRHETKVTSSPKPVGAQQKGPASSCASGSGATRTSWNRSSPARARTVAAFPAMLTRIVMHRTAQPSQ